MISSERVKEIEQMFNEYSEDFHAIDELIRKHNMPSYLSGSFREFLEQRLVSKAVADVIERDQVRRSLMRHAENLRFFYDCLMKIGFDSETAKSIVIGGAYYNTEEKVPGQLCPPFENE